MNETARFAIVLSGAWLAVGGLNTAALAQTSASLVWENQGHADDAAIPPTTQYNLGGSTLTVDWFLTTDGGTIIPYSGDDFVSYEQDLRGNTAGNLEVGFDNDAADQDDFFTLELTFNKIVEDLNFTVLDIDRGNEFWHDVVEVYYDDGTGFKNVSLDPTIWTLGGTKVALDDETYAVGWEGTGLNAVGNDATANIDLDFTGKDVIALRFVYYSGDDSQANPNGQVSGISDMTWTVPAPAGPEDHSDAPLTGTLYGDAVHPIVSGVRLGVTNTAELTGYDSLDASGDSDDGVTIPTLVTNGISRVTADVVGTGGYLQGWIDWNDDGDWNDAGEQIALNEQDLDADGQILIDVTPPITAALTQTIARFRWSTTPNINTTIAVTDGEVEDYQVTVSAPTPFTCDANLYQSIAVPSANDPSQLSQISISGGTQTLTTVGDTSHGVSYNAAGYNVLDNFIYGIERTAAGDTLVRVEGNGNAVRLGPLSQALGSQPGAGDMDASGNLYVRVGSSEDLYRINVATRQVTVIPSSMSTFSVADFAFNPNDGLMYGMASNTGQLYSLDPSNGTVTPIGSGDPSLNIFGAQYFDNAGHLYGLENLTGDLYRFDLTDGSAVVVATGGAPAQGNDGASCRGGTLSNADYTDAPSSFGTAAHLYDASIYLGNTIDFEVNAQYSADASADGADDDGIYIPEITLGQSGTIKATVTGAGGYLQGWIDWNDNGTFDAGEQVATDAQDTDNDGQIFIPVTAPATAATTEIIARFRWSTDMGLGASEFANDGEVEDYAITLRDPAAFTCPVGSTLSQITDHADTVVVAAGNSTRALGPLATAGSNAAPVSAVNSSVNPNLTLELTHLVPEGAPITFSLAKNNAGGNSDIDVSSDGTVYATQTTFSQGVEEVLEYITVIAPAGGTQFVRVQRNSGSVRIDGIQYDHACSLPGAELEAAKSVTVYDPAAAGLYALPGNDVIYTIAVTNTGDGSADDGSMVLIDRLPPEIEFYNGDIDDGGAETDPVSFSQTGGAGLTFNYATDVRFGTGPTKPADFASCTAITPDSTYRPDLTYICFNPKGAMMAGDPDPSFSVNFRVRIK